MGVIHNIRAAGTSLPVELCRVCSRLTHRVIQAVEALFVGLARGFSAGCSSLTTKMMTVLNRCSERIKRIFKRHSTLTTIPQKEFNIQLVAHRAGAKTVTLPLEITAMTAGYLPLAEIYSLCALPDQLTDRAPAQVKRIVQRLLALQNAEHIHSTFTSAGKENPTSTEWFQHLFAKEVLACFRDLPDRFNGTHDVSLESAIENGKKIHALVENQCAHWNQGWEKLEALFIYAAEHGLMKMITAIMNSSYFNQLLPSDFLVRVIANAATKGHTACIETLIAYENRRHPPIESHQLMYHGFLAAMKGDEDYARSITAFTGIASDDFLYLAIMTTVANDHVHCLKILLADTKALLVVELQELLSVASCNNSVQCLKWLLSNQNIVSEDIKISALYCAQDGYYECLKMLLSDPRMPRSFMGEIVGAAIEKNRRECVEALIANPLIPDHVCRFVLQLAVAKGYLRCVEILAGDKRIRDSDLRYAMQRAIENKYPRCTAVLKKRLGLA